jgi:hypothetical protein
MRNDGACGPFFFFSIPLAKGCALIVILDLDGMGGLEVIASLYVTD